jgi:AbrB family looped-hinge helix DNA binding protein
MWENRDFSSVMSEVMCPAKVHNRGRVTIDADVRRELGIEPGDHVILSVRRLGDSNDD